MTPLSDRIGKRLCWNCHTRSNKELAGLFIEHLVNLTSNRVVNPVAKAAGTRLAIGRTGWMNKAQPGSLAA